MKKTLKWYNKLSIVHDLMSFNDWPYQAARTRAIEMLALKPGNTVFDLFCGTGINFGKILSQINHKGQIIGVDGSAGMLAKAHERIEVKGWETASIQLLEKDLLHTPLSFFSEVMTDDMIPKVLVTLALGVFPNYQEVFQNILDAVPFGTRFAFLEGYCGPGSRGAWLINLIGTSDCSRRVWEPLEDSLNEFQIEWLPTKYRYIKGSLMVASGVKP